VLLTSMGRRGDARRFGELGFAAYLLKPVSQRDLRDCLQRLFAAEEAGRPTPLITRHQLRAWRSQEQPRLLLVDDNAVNLKVGKGLLDRLGYHVETANNGLEAVAAWEQRRYDVILIDCQMPLMDGYQATREIRRREAGKSHVPIIAVTAHAMLGAEEECRAAGMDAYQSKPLDRQRLQECLESLLARSPQPLAQTEVSADLGHASQVDWARVAQVSGGDREFAAELSATFVASAAQMLEQIDAAMHSRDGISLQRAAHTLKGAAASIGATLCQALAGNLEGLAKEQDFARSTGLVAQLRWAVETASRLLTTAA
jgi:CheY-like chemotaxis protein/HPt (histidine-containing phosphotransfer) domain-containing protein